MPPDASHAKELFVRAADLPENERAAYLDHACGDNLALRDRVSALLHAHVLAKDFLSPDHMEDSDSVRLHPGSIIGRYRLSKMIGEGGFGTVWRAEQTRPITRTVAIKIIKIGMDTTSVVARFRAERQALAMMDHPNIARVFDAGATPTGRPFFAMEYVPGESIVAHCRRCRLSRPERLQLFVDVCLAIQHAHQKGVIHRDIKPGNVLVMEVDDAPVVKVIDFGIAKAMRTRLTEMTLSTEQGQFLGTPEYMSPEQAGMQDLDVDTRSDVYSLGVLLFELLTDELPIDLTESRTGGYLAILDAVRNKAPRRLSTIDPRLRGDLEIVVQKALEKERGARYDSAGALGTDVRRFLANEPIGARPPSVSYQCRQFARRHRTLLGGLLAGFITLLAATGVSIAFGIDAWRSENEAQTRLYFNRIAQATVALEGLRLTEARAILTDCDIARRGWEWHCLWHRTEDAVHRIKLSHPQGGWKNMAVAREDLVYVVDRRIESVNPMTSDAPRFIGDVVRHRDTEIVDDVKLSPDGRLLAIAGRWMPAQVWDMEEAHCLFVQDVPGGALCVAFSSDGEVLLIGGGNGEIHVVDARTGETQRTLHGVDGQIWDLHVSPDGVFVAAGTYHGDVFVFDFEQSTMRVRYDVPERKPAIAWGRDSATLYCAGEGVVRRWSLEDLDDRPTVERISGARTVSVSPDGNFVVIGAGEAIEVRSADLLTAHAPASMLSQPTWFLPSGRIASVSQSLSELSIVDLARSGGARRCDEYNKPNNYILRFDLAPDDSIAAGATQYGDLIFWRKGSPGERTFASGPKLDARDETTNIDRIGMAFSVDSRSLFTMGADGHLIVWDCATASARLEHETGFTTRELVSAGDGVVYAGGASGEIAQINAENGVINWRFQVDQGVIHAMALSEDGRTLLTGGAGGIVSIIDVEEQRMIATVENDAFVFDVAWAPGDKQFAASTRNQVRVWDTATRTVHIDQSVLKPTALEFSPDGRRLVTGHQIWDTATGLLALTLSSRIARIDDVRFTADGSRLLTSSITDVWAWGDFAPGDEGW